MNHFRAIVTTTMGISESELFRDWRDGILGVNMLFKGMGYRLGMCTCTYYRNYVSKDAI